MLPVLGVDTCSGSPGKTWVMLMLSYRLKTTSPLILTGPFPGLGGAKTGESSYTGFERSPFHRQRPPRPIGRPQKRVNAVGGRFTIRHVDAQAMELFRITRLDHVFDMQV